VLQHLRVFSEYNSPAQPVVRPLIRIDMWYPRRMGHFGSVRMMKERLPGQIAQLEAAPEGERAIMLWWLLTHELYVAKGADPLAVYERGKLDTRRAIALLKPLSTEIKRLRIPIDLIFIDNEGGFGLFDIGPAKVRRILRSKRARSKMPAEVATLDISQLEFGAPGYLETNLLWTNYANKMKFDALRDVVTEAELFDVRPSPTAAIERPSSVNFWSMNPRWPIRDYNGWLQTSDSCLDGRSSGPSCYVGNQGAMYAGRMHHYIWNDLINLLNHVRSCVGKPDSVCHPVLANPLMCHPWIQEEMIRHMVRMGINWSLNRCAFLYWNANSPTENDPILADIMMRNDVAYPLRRNLPEIPLDVDTITTVDYTTTYEDFLINLAEVIDGGG
jgi:hypothetical protein